MEYTTAEIISKANTKNTEAKLDDKLTEEQKLAVQAEYDTELTKTIISNDAYAVSDFIAQLISKVEHTRRTLNK